MSKRNQVDWGYYASVEKQLLSFQDVAESYGIAFDRGYARCPFHTEKSASFSIKGNRGHCFGCGWSGDLIDFVEKYFGLDFKTFVEKVNNDFGLHLPIENLTEEKRRELCIKANVLQKRRLAEKRQAEAYKERYCELWDAWIKADRLIIAQKRDPIQDIDDFPDELVKAFKEKDYYNYLIDTELTER